jgi:hypothetical protein
MGNLLRRLTGDRAPAGDRIMHRIAPPQFLLHHAPVNYCHPYLDARPH